MSKFERNKDLAQEVVSSAAEHVGEIAKIITNAVVDVTRQIGEIATDAFEMREATSAPSRTVLGTSPTPTKTPPRTDRSLTGAALR